MVRNPDSQSAGVCPLRGTASQRINAKEIWYLLGLFESDGSLSCYYEKDYIRLDFVIVVEVADAKLTEWVKTTIGYGTVKHLKYSNNPNKLVSRYILRSKAIIETLIFKWFEQYPLLTKNKRVCYARIKESIKHKKIIPLSELENENSLIVPDVEKNPYIKDWIIGFIEGDGSFYLSKEKNSVRAEFNICQKNEHHLLEEIGKIMGLSGKNKVSIKKSGACILTAVSLQDIQSVVNFMCNPERVRLKGLKKVKFLIWLKELRRNPRYTGLKIPDKY